MSAHALSLEAYASVLPDLNRRQQEVLRIIREHGPITTEQIVDRMGNITINSATPRVLELRRKGLVEESHRELGKSGRRATAWRLKESE